MIPTAGRIALVCLLGLPGLARAQSPCTHYASPTGGGAGLSEGSPFPIADFWRVARPGATLCLLDGTYTGPPNMIAPPASFAGTASQPITIRTLHDGKVLVDGQGSRRPADLQGAWGILEGVNLRNGPDVALQIRGTHWQIRRVVAWDGALGGGVIALNGFHNTLEDCAAFGTGRYTLAAGAGNAAQSHNVMRRCWAQSLASQGESLTLFAGYGQGQVLLENMLANWNNTSSVPSNPVFEAFRTQHTRLLGSIVYALAGDANIPGMFRVHSQGGYNPQPAARTVEFQAKHILAFVHPGNPRFGSAMGLNMALSGDNNRLEDSLGVAARHEVPSGTARNVRTGRSLATALAVNGDTTVWTALPGICTRYVQGTLTTQPLWPWPMNARITEALRRAGRSVVDVTATMEALFGAIPAKCRDGGGGAPAGGGESATPRKLRIVSVP